MYACTCLSVSYVHNVSCITHMHSYTHQLHSWNCGKKWNYYYYYYCRSCSCHYFPFFFFYPYHIVWRFYCQLLPTLFLWLWFIILLLFFLLSWLLFVIVLSVVVVVVLVLSCLLGLVDFIVGCCPRGCDYYWIVVADTVVCCYCCSYRHGHLSSSLLTLFGLRYFMLFVRSLEFVVAVVVVCCYCCTPCCLRVRILCHRWNRKIVVELVELVHAYFTYLHFSNSIGFYVQFLITCDVKVQYACTQPEF